MGRSLSRFTRNLARHVGSEPIYRGQRLFGEKQYVVVQPSQWPYMFHSGPLILKQGHPVRTTNNGPGSPVRGGKSVPLSTVGDAEVTPQCLVIGVDGQVYRGDNTVTASSPLVSAPPTITTPATGLPSLVPSPAPGTIPNNTPASSPGLGPRNSFASTFPGLGESPAKPSRTTTKPVARSLARTYKMTVLPVGDSEATLHFALTGDGLCSPGC